MSLKKSCSRTIEMRCNILMSMLFFRNMRYTFSREVGMLRAKATTVIPLSWTCFCISLQMWTIVFSVLLWRPGGRSGTPGHEKSGKLFDCLPLWKKRYILVFVINTHLTEGRYRIIQEGETETQPHLTVIRLIVTDIEIPQRKNVHP